MSLAKLIVEVAIGQREFCGERDADLPRNVETVEL